MGLKMKSDLKSIDTKSIGTAKDNARLRVLGEVKTPMILKTVNPELSFIIRPIVVDGLSMNINISGPWMRSNAWDQIHSTNSIRIDQKHILKLKSRASSDPRCARLFTTTDFTVQANSIAFVTLFAPQVKTGVVTRGSGTISGSPHFRRATGLHPFTAAINNVNHIGLTSAAVVNSSGQDIIVRKGSTNRGRRLASGNATADDIAAEKKMADGSFQTQIQALSWLPTTTGSSDTTFTRILGLLQPRRILWQNVAFISSNNY